MKLSPTSIRPTDSLCFTLFALIALLTGLPSAADEVSADRSQTRQDGAETTRTYAGDVSATLRRAHITADSAVVATSSDRYTFYHSVRFQDDRYVVYADRAEYDVEQKVAVLSGRVRLSDGDRALTAGRVTYWPERRQIESSDTVQMDLDGISVQIDRWHQDVAADTASGRGHVSFTTDDSASVKINSHHVLVKDSAKWLQFSQDVKIHLQAWTAEADTAEYDRAESRLLMKPRGRLVRYSEASGVSDSTTARGNETAIQMKEGTIDHVDLSGDVSLVIARTDSLGLSTSTVTSDTARVRMIDGDLSVVQVRGSVLLQVNSDGALSSRLETEHTDITFAGGVPEQIRVEGEGHLIYGATTDSLRADITGYGMTISLENARIRQVEVDSNAVCQVDGIQPVHLSGKQLILRLSGQSLTQAEVKGAVQGRYEGIGANP